MNQVSQENRQAKKENHDEKALIEAFLQAQAIQGLRSTKHLQRGISLLTNWLDDERLDLFSLDALRCERFQHDLVTRCDDEGNTVYRMKTVSSIMWAVKKLVSWLVQEGHLHKNPFDAVISVKLPKRIPRTVPEEKELLESLRLLSQFWEEDNVPNRRSRYRTHVIAELLYATGMRLGELGSLVPSDVDLVAKTVKIRDGKGGVARTAYLNDYAASVLSVYISTMRETMAYRQGNETLFCTKAGSSIGSIINKNLVKYLGMHTHDFRHAVGTHLLKAGCDLRMIQLILGHEDLKSTAIYTKVAKEDLRDQLDRHHPRGLRKKDHASS